MIEKHAQPLGRADQLVAEREAKVLSWSLLARLVFLVIAAALTVLQLADFLPPGIMAQGPDDAWPTLAMLVAGGIASGALFGLIRRHGRHVRMVGMGAVLIDMSFLALLPWIWLHTVPDLAAFPVGLVKGELFGVALLFIVINSMSLSPQYPAVMAIGSIGVLSTIALLTLDDPGVTFTASFVEHFRTESVNLGILLVRIVILALSGAFLSALAYTARKTIRQAVNLELDNLELKEMQAEMAFEGRMAALDGMVAGIAHEINSPLGAVRSSVDTTSAAVKKLVPAEHASNPQTQRTLQLVDDVTGSARDGLDRISGLVDSLRDFSRIDEAGVQNADIRTELDTVLSLIDAEAIGNVEIHKEYGTIPQIECRPRELNQAFLTILVNAFEAMAGEGRLSIGTTHADGNIRITIADSGPGIPAELRDNLFDLNFSQKGKRVGMGLGLPTSRRIVERHDGKLSIDPAIDQGTQFTISLPVRTQY
jgi:signal transduction histidine kinase